MLTRFHARTSVLATLALALPGYGFVAAPTSLSTGALDTVVEQATETIKHVANLPYEKKFNNSASDGTDLEFATLTVDHDQDPSTPAEERTFAVAGSYDNGVQIVDVTDPAKSRIVATYDCGVYQGDIQIFTRDDLPGRTFATVTQDDALGRKTQSQCYADTGAQRAGKTDGTFIFEITNPYSPSTISFVGVPQGSHNMTVHPSGKYLYNSNSDLITTAGTQAIEVYDITDIRNPRKAGELALELRPGLGTESHDVTFNEDGSRAYSAALSHTAIIDTEDPANPVLISSIFDPAINVVHQSDPITIDDPNYGEHTFLVIEDEFAGAAGAEQTCPSGGVHVYDITDEANPLKVGYWNTNPGTTEGVGLNRCTAHVFQLHEDEALMTIAYYNQGVRVVDLSGLVGVAVGGTGVGMKEVAAISLDNDNSWAVKAPFVDRDGTFHIYSNDQARGLDVYEVDLSNPAAVASVDAGQWLNAVEAYELLGNRTIPADYTPYCLLGDK